MGRIYSINFTGTAVTASVDILELLAASGKPFILHSVCVTQSSDAGDAAAEMLSFTIQRATGSYTSGSGGNTAIAGKANTSDTTCGASLECVNTTKAVVGTGTLTVLHAENANIQIGWFYLPPPESRFVFAPAEACIVRLESTPADSLTMSCTAVIEELG